MPETKPPESKDVAGLRAAFQHGELLDPFSGAGNLVDLSRALACLINVDDMLPTVASADLARLIEPSPHIVFFLVDGLGMNVLEMLPDGGFLRAHLRAELRAVFPSATGVSLTTIATGTWPSDHAVTGWWTYLLEANTVAALLPFVTREGRRSISELGLTAPDVFPVPSVIGDTPRDALAILPERLRNGVYTRYSCGAMAMAGYQRLPEAIDLILHRVMNSHYPTYTYLYTPRLDSASHNYGITSPDVRHALVEVDREMARLSAGLAGRGRVILTADHGLLDTPAAAKHKMGSGDPLLSLLRVPPSGDARVAYFHIQEGARKEFVTEFHRRYGDAFFLLSTEEADALHLFGPGAIAPMTRQRVGDVMAISRGEHVLAVVLAGVRDHVLSWKAHHSGFTPAEMRIPLIVL